MKGCLFIRRSICSDDGHLTLSGTGHPLTREIRQMAANQDIQLNQRPTSQRGKKQSRRTFQPSGKLKQDSTPITPAVSTLVTEFSRNDPVVHDSATNSDRIDLSGYLASGQLSKCSRSSTGQKQSRSKPTATSHLSSSNGSSPVREPTDDNTCQNLFKCVRPGAHVPVICRHTLCFEYKGSFPNSITSGPYSTVHSLLNERQFSLPNPGSYQ